MASAIKDSESELRQRNVGSTVRLTTKCIHYLIAGLNSTSIIILSMVLS